jgi:hypothetical protein
MKMMSRLTCLAVLIALCVAITSCSPSTPTKQVPSVFETMPVSAITESSALTQTAEQVLYNSDKPLLTANHIALNAFDLGDGWELDAEVADLDASYYFDMSQDGKAIIGTHRTITTPAFDPAIVESIVMRGFSNSQKNAILFHHVVVFKETEQAVKANRRFQQDDIEASLPREWTSDYGERYSAHAVALGDQGAMMIGWLDEDHPIIISLEFRKDRVWVGLGSMGLGMDPDKFPPLSEADLEEFGELAEKNIEGLE